MRRVVSPTGIIHAAKFCHRKLRQTIYELRVTTVPARASTYYPLKDYYSALPYFRVQFVLPIQLSTIHLYPPVVVEYPRPQSYVMSVNCARLYTSFSITITENGNVENRMNFKPVNLIFLKGCNG